MHQLPTRTNEVWTNSLRGTLGNESQSLACTDLANYLYVVLYNELRKRSTYGYLPSILEGRGCEFLAEDIAQCFMEKLLADEFALLDKYAGRGRFTSWAAQVARNMLFTELRRGLWKRQESLDESETLVIGDNRPERLALQGHISEAIENCLELLPHRSRVALLRCSLEGEKAATVADDLGITANAVNILVCRAKKMMRKYLEAEGILSSEPLLPAPCVSKVNW